MYRRTTWIEGCDTEARVSGRIAAKPGVHYVVRPCDFDEDYYYTYPHEPVDIYSIFRHAWVLERRRRPVVVCIEGVQVPKANKSAVDNSKYCSMFFRPWSLNLGCVRVPHVTLLAYTSREVNEFYEKMAHCRETMGKRRRMVGKQQVLQQNFVEAWKDYINGHVVSLNAEKLIRSFLLHTIAAS